MHHKFQARPRANRAVVIRALPMVYFELFGTAQDTRYGVEVKQVSILIVLLYLCATEEEKRSGLSPPIVLGLDRRRG